MIYFLTYATHNEGKYEELMNNEHGVEIINLGWGKKWNGFTDRYKSYLEFMKNLYDDDIICCIDGFDSKIIKGPDVIEKRFRQLGSKILFSKDPELSYFHKFFIYKTCNNNTTANAGCLLGTFNI